MKIIYRLFLRDWKYSLLYGKWKYGAWFLFFAFLTLMMSVRLNQYGVNSADIIFMLLKDEGYFQFLSEYEVPIYWVFTQFFIIFLIGDFLSEDFQKNRIYLLLRSRSKSSYFLSKIGWLIMQNIGFIIGLFLSIYLVSSITLRTFSLETSLYFQDTVVPLMDIPVSASEVVTRIIVGYLVTSLALSGLLFLTMQLLSPALAFLGIIILSGVSTILDSKWLPGIHSMILKQSIFANNYQLSMTFSLVYSFVVFLVSSIIAYLVFNKKNNL